MINKFLLGTALALFCVVQQGNGDPQPSAEIGSEANSEIPAEEKPFRDSAQLFVDAYAKRDVAAIGMLFTENAQFRDCREFLCAQETCAGIVSRASASWSNTNAVSSTYSADAERSIVTRLAKLSDLPVSNWA